MSLKGWLSNIAGVLLLASTLTGSSSFAGDTSTHEAKGSVTRGIFTTAVVDREPQDVLTTFPNDQYSIIYFSELKNMAGQRVTHRWEYNGQVMADISFNVGGDRWRTHSSKNLQPIWLGEWTVSVLDADMNVVSRNSFNYIVASPSTPASIQK